MESYIGRTLGDFEIRRPLANGGQGFVFVAGQKALKREVTLKVIPFPVTVSSNQVKSFIRGAEATARVKHPNIVEIYQIEQDVGHYFYAMELVDGWPLNKIIAGMKKYVLVEQEEACAVESSDEPPTLVEDDFCLKDLSIVLRAADPSDESEEDVEPAEDAQEEGTEEAAKLRKEHYDRIPQTITAGQPMRYGRRRTPLNMHTKAA